MTLAAFIPAFF
jgi:hypothetical protein